uniref:protein-tyrosine-phosphatase n=1 Tax=Nomascus leucogenys TaxID=61853 RepID=A0A2I3GKF8_NOMLE
MEEAQRSYILTQGPLPNTCGHFWEMVWEQKSRGVVMLNRVMEKGSVKVDEWKVTLCVLGISDFCTDDSFRIIMSIFLFQTQETREILHFHYTTWPDFGVPESPASFLNFLFKVRESGSLSPEHGPVVVHCSAGIGRSGTFCLADTCLLLMDKRKDPSSVDIKKKFRMGLIQTADQLRFSYLAVIEPHNGKCREFFPNHQWVKDETQEDKDCPIKEEKGSPLNATPYSMESMSQDTEVRSRVVGGSLRGAQAASPAKGEPSLPEKDEDHALSHWKPFLVNMCVATVLTAGAYLCYRTRWRDARVQRALAASPMVGFSFVAHLSQSQKKQIKGF